MTLSGNILDDDNNDDNNGDGYGDDNVITIIKMGRSSLY